MEHYDILIIGGGAAGIAAAKAANKLLSIKNINAAFALVKIGDTIHISARSNGTVNVQLILEQLNGGGHYDVAGAQISDMTMQEVLSLLRTAIDTQLDLD
jgi:c-di-AMP phosphodiesterase-like protein